MQCCWPHMQRICKRSPPPFKWPWALSRPSSVAQTGPTLGRRASPSWRCNLCCRLLPPWKQPTSCSATDAPSGRTTARSFADTVGNESEAPGCWGICVGTALSSYLWTRHTSVSMFYWQLLLKCWYLCVLLLELEAVSGIQTTPLSYRSGHMY